MELFPDVPSGLGPRPVWLAFLRSASDWRQLLEDVDWDRLVERERRPFGLFTVSPNPKREQPAWLEFSDYCVEKELMLVCSWGPNASLLDDLFDEAGVGRSVDHLPGAEPLTTWHDHEPLEEALDFFLNLNGVDLRLDDDAGTNWERVAVVFEDEARCDQLRALLTDYRIAG